MWCCYGVHRVLGSPRSSNSITIFHPLPKPQGFDWQHKIICFWYNLSSGPDILSVDHCSSSRYHGEGRNISKKKEEAVDFSVWACRRLKLAHSQTWKDSAQFIKIKRLHSGETEQRLGPCCTQTALISSRANALHDILMRDNIPLFQLHTPTAP